MNKEIAGLSEKVLVREDDPRIDLRLALIKKSLGDGQELPASQLTEYVRSVVPAPPYGGE